MNWILKTEYRLKNCHTFQTFLLWRKNPVAKLTPSRSLSASPHPPLNLHEFVRRRNHCRYPLCTLEGTAQKDNPFLLLNSAAIVSTSSPHCFNEFDKNTPKRSMKLPGSPCQLTQQCF